MKYLRILSQRLGIPYLLPEWKNLLSTHYFLADLSAGITVAFVAIPLSLAIALASGVSPGTGLITAIIAGIVCALFGGTSLAVSGPAAAMSVLIADIVEKFGVSTLAVVCLIAGLLQFVSGFLGLGRLGRYVPLPVIAGFTAGIGAIILVGQLPRAFGLMPPAESHVFDVLIHIKQYFHQINGTCLLLVIVTLLIIRGLPKLFPNIPAILTAVIVATLMVYFFNLTDVPLIGAIPSTLPLPQLPAAPTIPLQDLLLNAFTIYLLASLETLLSSSAVDKLTNQKKHNSNQELIGQGLGNITVAMFGGIPVTGVVARSATNVKAGAKTRKASIIHSLIILLTVFSISPLISLIPIAALAGVLFSVAFSMLNYKEFHNLWVTTRTEAVIYAVTFLVIIFVDLIAGVQAGIAAACLILLFKAAQARLFISATTKDDMIRLSLTGTLTFLSTGKIVALEKQLESASSGQTAILDLSSLSTIDTSGATAIVDLFNLCQEKNIQFFIKGLSRQFESLFRTCGGAKLIDHCYLVSEHELRQKETFTAPQSARGRLVHGVNRFYTERKQNDKRLFEYISQKQNPHTLFITCSDSRIIPSLITSTDPGELFIIRNVGNFIPPYNPNIVYSEAAALEFALTHLDITDIVVCGHANCGAINACVGHGKQPLTPKLADWIALMRTQLYTENSLSVDEVAQMNVLNQVKNLKQYPIIQQQLAARSINIHGWFFDFSQNHIFEWDDSNHQFKSLIMDPIL